MEVRVREEKYDRDIVLTSRTTESSAQACEQALSRCSARWKTAPEPCRRVRVPTAKRCRSDAARQHGSRRSTSAVVRWRASGLSARLSIGWACSTNARQSAWKSKVPSPTTRAALGNLRRHDHRYRVLRQRPPFEALAYDESRIVRRMSIGDRHRLASRLQLPADAIVVPQQCQVSRQTGAVLVCHPGANATADPDVLNVAGRYAGAMAFDLSGLDRDDPQAVLVEIPVRVARSDVRPLSFAGTGSADVRDRVRRGTVEPGD